MASVRPISGCRSKFLARKASVIVIAAIAMTCAGLTQASATTNTLALPVSSSPESVLACTLFDDRIAAEIGLATEQRAEWQHLQQLHEQLYEKRCSSSATAPLNMAKIRGNRHNPSAVSALQAYHHGFRDFLARLSPGQRERLTAAVHVRSKYSEDSEDSERSTQSTRFSHPAKQAHTNVDVDANLDEKLIRHRLML